MREQRKILTRMNSHKSHVPIRTCVSCRSKQPKKGLVRLVLDKDNRVIIDEFQKKEGRGIYVCNNISCIERYFKNKAMKTRKALGD